jgi:hypothetical protein
VCAAVEPQNALPVAKSCSGSMASLSEGAGVLHSAVRVARGALLGTARILPGQQGCSICSGVAAAARAAAP